MTEKDRAAETHFEFAVRLAIEGLKALLIFNGGAALALIALVGNISKSNVPNSAISHSFLWPITLFGTGAFLALVAMALAYFSQLSYANHKFMLSHEDHATARTQHSRHQRFQHLAIATVVVALLFGLAGILSVWCAVAYS